MTFPELGFFEEVDDDDDDGFFFPSFGFPVANELRSSPDLPRLPPMALGVSSGIVCKSGKSTVITPGSGRRTTALPRRPPSCPPPTSFSIRFSAISLLSDLSDVVDLVGSGAVTRGVLLSPELAELTFLPVLPNHNHLQYHENLFQKKQRRLIQR